MVRWARCSRFLKDPLYTSGIRFFSSPTRQLKLKLSCSNVRSQIDVNLFAKIGYRFCFRFFNLNHNGEFWTNIFCGFVFLHFSKKWHCKYTLFWLTVYEKRYLRGARHSTISLWQKQEDWNKFKSRNSLSFILKY